MINLKIYQIGVGSFGRYGFEKFIEMHKHFDKADINLAGVCEKDFQLLEKAEKFAEANGIKIETFQDVKEMYKHASEQEEKVLIYDASPSTSHSQHIHLSMENNFFHIAEKPPSMTREEHIKEKKMAKNREVFWTVDFIERESPVVKKTIHLIQGKDLHSITIFRESSIGVQKILQPVKRSGVKGGDILDKMVHEIYIYDILDSADKNSELELVDADSEYFMPKSLGSEKMMSIEGGPIKDIKQETATGQTQANLKCEGVKIELNSSWLGISSNCETAAKRIEKITGHNPIKYEYKSTRKRAFSNEEARFFVIEGEKNLFGDLLAEKLYDLDTGQEIETPDLLHDQLYRVLEKAVLKALGQKTGIVTEKETEKFMEKIFDIKKSAGQDKEFLEELEKANEKVRKMIIEELEKEEEVAA